VLAPGCEEKNGLKIIYQMMLDATYPVESGCSWTMLRKDLSLIAGILSAVALASTAIALALERYFGPLPLLALLGQSVAVTGAAVFALWHKGRR
jgi:hypothetical protein